MILLLTSNLNGHLEWYEWLVRVADRVDAICVAGDLINPFHDRIHAQRDVAEFAAWQITGKCVDFFACEGDQDLWGPRWFWLKSLSGTRRSGTIAVTSIPWKSKDQIWFEKPSRWRQESENWLILTHEPPRGTAVSRGTGLELLGNSLAMNFMPDFLLSGHMRNAPWLAGGSWWDRRGQTFVFNAGFDPLGEFPCHILLDTTRREATWKHPGGHEHIQLDAFTSLFPSSHPSIS